MTERVAQPNEYGCSIACIAMVVGKSYEATEAWLVDEGLTRERMRKGLHEGVYLEALGRLGFAFRQMYRHDAIRGADREPWPPRPFAPIHLCTAYVAAGSHAFVMSSDGTILDPYKAERTAIDHPDYLKVNQVIGLWRVPQWTSSAVPQEI